MKLSKTQWAFVVDSKTGKTDIHIPKMNEYERESLENVFDGIVSFMSLMAELTGRIEKVKNDNRFKAHKK